MIACLSKNIRLLCGGILIILGYIPVFLDTSSKDNSSPPVPSELNASCEISRTLTYDVYRPDLFFNRFDIDNKFLSSSDVSSSSVSDSTSDNNISGSSASDDTSIAAVLNSEKTSAETSETPDTSVTKPKTKVLETFQKACASHANSSIRSVKTGEFAGAVIVQSRIRSNFYVDARRLGVPAGVVDTIIKNMSARLDFRRSLKVGDSFEIMYKKNELLYSKISTKNKECAVYKFSTGKSSSYFFEDGEKSCNGNGKDSSFGSPLSGRLSISDRFGYRRHPITGKRHIHTGVDFRASVGSPVHAIYDGIVTRASYYSGYGHCIDIRHPNGYSSRYGHLSKYNVKCGTKVRKGQVIGRSGSSGHSTGPHVHLELAKNNVTIDPLQVKMMPSIKQSVPNMKVFRYFISKINKTLLHSEKNM
ncbi:MAG: M23 family metallopeptidase [Holosporaceae bacterium]|nr:M23 family metallopeptidase [Holosporaceae bacterium]